MYWRVVGRDKCADLSRRAFRRAGWAGQALLAQQENNNKLEAPQSSCEVQYDSLFYPLDVVWSMRTLGLSRALCKRRCIAFISILSPRDGRALASYTSDEPDGKLENVSPKLALVSSPPPKCHPF